MEVINLLFACLAALAAGFINSIAGGGTLVTFPVLTAIGISPVAANVTNSVALTPGLLSGVYAQKDEFQTQKKTLWKILPFSILGGILGAILLLNTSERSFEILIPYLILLATALLAFQTPIKKMIIARAAKTKTQHSSMAILAVFVFIASVYGGYFGAGLGVILMAILGLLLKDSLTKLNVLKQAISFSVNLIAAIYFCFSGKVEWMVALVMIIGSITGGTIGGKLASKIKPNTLKWIVVSIGFVVSVIYFAKAYHLA